VSSNGSTNVVGMADRLGRVPPAEADALSAADVMPNNRPAAARDDLRLFTIGDLASLPRPSWLVQDLLPASALAVLYGRSGVGKSFLALDFALCVASGAAWFGQRVKQGAVVYIAAEGLSGLALRIDAWVHERTLAAPQAIRFVGRAVNFLDSDDLHRARAAIERLNPAPSLVVVDTLARSMVGGDENAARDIGLFVRACDVLRAPSAAMLVVHHTGRDGGDERGSSALRGAADVMLAVKPDGANLRLECTKAKDAEPCGPWRLHLQPVRASCVLSLGTRPGVLAPTEVRILERVAAAFGTQWAAGAAFREAAGAAKSSYFRSLRTLIDAGYVTAEDASRRPRYRVTDSGRRRVSPSPKARQETPPASSAVSPSKGTAGPGRSR
jgi:hypothetical protein